MSVIRVDNFIDAYRIRAHAPDIHAMAARRKEATEFVSECVLQALELEATDTLVDIGCGDGCLLRMAEGMVAKRMGIVATEDEKKRLEPTMRGAAIVKGLCQQLPLPSESASKVVCNGVLFYLSSADEVRASLREMARIARPGARVWVGEIPIVDEFEKFGMYCGSSVIGLLRHTLVTNGPRAFLGMLRRLAKSLVGRDQVVLNSARLFHATPEEFVKLAEGSGLRLESYSRHRDIDKEGNPVVSQLRYDYLFCK